MCATPCHADETNQTIGPESTLLNNLAVAEYRLRFRSPQPYRIRGYRGSAWRGVLGHALKKLVCVTREPSCSSCLLYRSCIYPYVFETPASRETAQRTGDVAPHPFVLRVGASTHEREVTEEMVGLTLIGKGNQYLAYLAHALRDAAQTGIGIERVKLELAAVEQRTRLDWPLWRAILGPEGTLNPTAASMPTAPPVPRKIRVQIHTPLRLKRLNDLVTPQLFGFDAFMLALLRRMASLAHYHSSGAGMPDIRKLADASRQIPLGGVRLAWRDWTRYSNRQGTKMQLGGLVGEFDVNLESAPELWPYLWIGQWLHAGKGTSMGLGRYEVKAIQ